MLEQEVLADISPLKITKGERRNEGESMTEADVVCCVIFRSQQIQPFAVQQYCFNQLCFVELLLVSGIDLDLLLALLVSCSALAVTF
jgi:hypothetical protein